MLSQCVQSFSSHCRGAFSCAFDACVRGGWTKAMCLVRPHTERCESLQIMRKTDNQMYKTCLVSNRPAASPPSTLGIYSQSHWSQLLFHLGSVRSTSVKRKKKKISLTSHNSLRGTGSTFDISQHERRVSPCRPSQYQK